MLSGIVYCVFHILDVLLVVHLGFNLCLDAGQSILCSHYEFVKLLKFIVGTKSHSENIESNIFCFLCNAEVLFFKAK